MTDDYAKRWVVVSGASSGIGRATAVSLSRAGARVVLMGRREDRLRETAALCDDPSGTEVFPLDLAHTDAIAPAIASLAARIGRIYGLCHCAGTVQTLPLYALKPERMRAAFEINFIAGMELVRAVTHRNVLDTGAASILWMASVYAHTGAPGQVGYCASKGAVVSAVRAMALELAPRSIRVNSLSPGFVRTEMTTAGATALSEEQWARIVALHPLGAGTPEDVARAATFMLHPVNTWLTGADWILDGGYTLN
jgi:NAD(P)-dependent dehydrogenase (short-subunit alcohol dehydrogenase family)